MQVILTAIDDDLAEAWNRSCGHLDCVSVHRGSILDVDCDAVVSPANSFGFMDGGIDASYAKYFGAGAWPRHTFSDAARLIGRRAFGRGPRDPPLKSLRDLEVRSHNGDLSGRVVYFSTVYSTAPEKLVERAE